MRHAILLAGGQGKRFWPNSRRARPKQFVRFDGRRSLLRATAERLLPAIPFERQWVVTHRDYVARVRQELPELPPGHVIGEPRALNTAAAVALGSAFVLREDPAAVTLVQAADHSIGDAARFRVLLAGALGEVERDGRPVLIGFRPTRPATGYGYIQAGARQKGPRGLRLFAVASYREKPDAATARRYLARGGYYWNGCMFCWPAALMLDEIERRLPALGGKLVDLRRRLASGRGLTAAIDRLYRDSPPVSIEHGVVEKLGGLRLLEGDCGWEDVGTWGALFNLFPRDAAGNVVRATHLGIDTTGSLVLADSGLVVTVGLRDLIVVRDGDAVLILPREREDELRGVVEALERDPRFAEFL